MPEEKAPRAQVLDPIDRASEAIFGLLMAVSIIGSLSVATAGRQEIRTMLLSALGCNLAWGLTDAVMYLVRATTENHRRIALLRRLRETADLRVARRMVADALPDQLAGGAGEETLEAIRKRLVAIPVPQTALVARDYLSALGVFALVVLATFPVVVPFLFIRDVPIAMRVSNILALAALYAYGHVLGQYAGGKAWQYGVAIAALGMFLVAVIMALGG
jgi:VIT1/CCC1 family predicted Fe2+/Mn2+ transporter